uniref:Inositol-pentakisphosphate 2-kinase n=1 Tax=Strongyloides venezuelensis TaxID=75913 RepID=A0A0K0F1G1_STRVS
MKMSYKVFANGLCVYAAIERDHLNYVIKLNIKLKQKNNKQIEDLLEDYLIGDEDNEEAAKKIYLQSTIEFQKRFLPHIYMLIKVSKDDFRLNFDQVDECVKAEFPDKEKNPRLFEIVTKTIVHSRCDISKTKVPCWNEEKNICTKKFPEQYHKYTHKSNGDKISANVVETVESKDEVKLHIDVRYVRPSEAVWRIMEYPILYKDWTVVRLAVHLINEECTVADEINNGNNNCFNAEKGYKSTLVAYYNPNENDINARKEEKLRHRQRRTIGRIFTVSPMNVELFSLRQLLLHVPGAKCEDAAIARGLLDTENNYNKLFQKACESAMPNMLRNYFGLMICY